MTRAFAALRRSLFRLFVAIAAVVAFAGVAEAHRLKMFVTVEDGEISGYAFFIGGGRPEGVDFVVKNTAGSEVFRGKTDDQGNFRWRPTAAADYTVTVDSGDGHWVEGAVSADRLGAVAPAPAAATSTEISPPATPAPASNTVSTAPTPTIVCPAPLDPAALAKIVEAQVDKSVARQLRPMIEAYDQAEGRVRLNDVMGGIGMIVGLAGAGLWATSRRRRPDDGA
ncbi:MAG: cobalamin biosynthesis protein CbiM [Phyllobacteriaceae bacterium]|nr:cobalamin biosynthesis protein CbiM [Phyllobacteriaceae bacterium]